MSLLKNWKLLLAGLGVVLLTACAGSSGGSASEGAASEGGAVTEAPKEVIDEAKLKKAEKEAMALTEENHKMRKEIFESKNKLGISTAPVAEEAPAEEAAEAAQ